MGVIDSLSAGFKLILRRWWLILIPIALDLFLWMGPQLSVAQVIQDARQLIVPPAGMELGKDYQATLAQLQPILDQVAKDSNLFALVGAGIPGIPSLMTAARPEVSLWAGQRLVVQVSAFPEALLWSLALLVASALLGSFYVTWIGRAVVAGAGDLTTVPLLRQVFRTWTRLLLFMLVTLILLFAIGLPASLLIAFVLLLSQTFAMILANLMFLLALWVGIWIVVYLYFVVDAIVINQAGLLRAIWNSVNVVTRNLWASLGLIMLIWVINNGLMLIWQRLEFASWGALLAIAANAFVGSGLMAAGLIFYQARYKRWQENPTPPGLALFTNRWGGPKQS